jgi:hypothetical protein
LLRFFQSISAPNSYAISHLSNAEFRVILLENEAGQNLHMLSSLRARIVSAAVLLTAVLFLNGCHKKEAATTTSLSPAAPAQANPILSQPSAETPPPPPPPPGSGDAAPSQPQPGTPAATGPSYQVDEKLFPILEKFYNDNLRPAMNWQDLVGGKYIPAIPLGPDGKPLDWNTTMQRLGKAAAARAGH